MNTSIFIASGNQAKMEKLKEIMQTLTLTQVYDITYLVNEYEQKHCIHATIKNNISPTDIVAILMFSKGVMAGWENPL